MTAEFRDSILDGGHADTTPGNIRDVFRGRVEAEGVALIYSGGYGFAK